MRPIVNVPEEDRATDIGNIHRHFGKDRACGSGDILADRQTDRQTHSSQYFATAPESKVTITTYYASRGLLYSVSTAVKQTAVNRTSAIRYSKITELQ